MMATIFIKFNTYFFQYLPCLTVTITFLPIGLVYGYTLSSFVTERNHNNGLIAYGPLILGACWGLFTALTMFLVKYLKHYNLFWHIDILFGAAIFNLISSCFYFANGYDNVGAFISYVAHSMTFLAGLTYINIIAGKCMRIILLSIAFNFYLLGIGTSISLIGSSYNRNLEKNNTNATVDDLIDGIYVNFAAVYLSISIVVLLLLIGLKFFNYFGHTDYSNCMDNDIRIANTNKSIFDKRSEILKRVQFFYVEKTQQWNITGLLLYIEAVQYALFLYFIYWFALNPAISFNDISYIPLTIWTTFIGSIVSTILLAFISNKILFVANQICLIVLTIITMIICSNLYTFIPFWLLLFFFGMSFSNLKLTIIEFSHFLFSELILFITYFIKLLVTAIICYYFVSDTKNSYFYSTDLNTLMAQGFIFIIITALLALIVGMKIARTYRATLFEIQYELFGMIFKKHQIEQLNIRWLNDGTIPTISRQESF